MAQHKWHKEIIHWANGGEIEFFHRIHQKWVDAAEPPIWELDVQYRIKPQPKEPQYLYVYKVNKNSIELCDEYSAYTKDLYIGKIKLEIEE